jgi:small-conductance mechanosensitive channel
MKELLVYITGLALLFIFKFNKTNIWIGLENKYLDTIVSYLFSLLILMLIRSTLIYIHRKRKKLREDQVDSIISGLQNIYGLIAIIITIASVLTLMGIDVISLLSSLTIIAAAIAVLSKDYISNIISGMLLAFSNDISLGDYIKVGQNKGRIIDMSLTMISILTDNDDVAIVPNNMVYTLDVINYTKREIKKTSIEFEVQLVAIETVKKLEEDLIAAVEEYKDMIQPNSYNIRVDSIKKDLLECKFQYILKAPDRDLENSIRKKVIRSVVQIVKT